jgi:hypothetical protein
VSETSNWIAHERRNPHDDADDIGFDRLSADSGFERPRPLIPQTAIRDTGADKIALVLQGLLVAGDRVAEAASPRCPKCTRKPKAHTKNNDGAVSTEVAALDR